MPLKLPSNEQFLFLANIVVNQLLFRSKPKKDITNILVVKLDEIGDMATATHVFQLLKNRFQNSKITVLCKPFVNDLIINDPNIDVVSNEKHLNFKSFDTIIELRGNWNTLFKALRCIGKVRLSRAEVRFQNKGQQLHEVDTNFHIIKPLLKLDTENIMPQLYFSIHDQQIVDDFLNQNKINQFAVFHVGARRKLRQWNLDRFAFVADYLINNYQFQVVFAGTKNEEQDILMVQNFMKNESFRFCNDFSLSQLTVLCSKSSFFIGNESGPLHIASVFNQPIIGLFGPGVPNVFYPKSANASVLHHVLECNPCNQIDCITPNNPCISLIETEQVLSLIQKKLK